MNLELYKQVHSRITAGDLDGTLQELVAILQATGDSPFSTAAEENFTNTPEKVNGWLSHVTDLLSEKADLKFVYVEMNGFEINYDRWFCDPFGYTRDIGPAELDDLADFQAELPSRESLKLIGMEPMQEAFRWWNEDVEDRSSVDAESLAQLIVQCRFLALIRDAATADQLSHNVPVAAATHDSDIVLRFDPGIS